MAGKTDSSLSPPRTPASGTVILVCAGGQTDIDFDFINDDPDNLGDFYLRVEGQPAAWADGVGEKFKVSAAPLAAGILRLTLKPPVAAEPGQYAFQVKTMSEGISVGNGPIKLILNVAPAAPAKPTESTASTSERPEHADANADSLAFVTLPGVSGREQPPDTAKLVPAPAPTVPVSEPMSEPRVEIAPVASAFDTRTFENASAVVSMPRPHPNSTGDNTGREPRAASSKMADREQEDRLSNTRPPSHDPSPAQNARSGAQNPASLPSPISEPTPVLVNPGAEQGVPLPGPNEEATETGNEEPSFETETNVLDPQDGAVFKMRPGETLLLRFKFTNQTPRTLNYVLDESDPLAIDWTERVRENVNLTRGLQGEVALRLKPPLNARPGDYPFGVTAGPQGTQVLPRAFTLTVLPTPAVRLLTNKGTKEGTKEGAKEATVKGGPFSRILEFQLTVDSVGNSDTAFRIAVKAPHDENGATGNASTEAGNLYETPQWRFLFDKEMENLKSPSLTLPPRPVHIRLRAQFKDAWWWGWGFQDRQQMQVAAVPVTDITNGGKRDNTITLTAVRNRYLPFPAILLVPALLLFLFALSGAPDELSVENALYKGPADNEYWVANVDAGGEGTKNRNTVDFNLKWSAPFYSLLRVTDTTRGTVLHSPARGSGYQSVSAPLDMNGFDKQSQYSVSQVFGGQGKDIVVHSIFTRSGVELSVPGHTLLAQKDKPGVFVLDMEVGNKANDKAEFKLFNNSAADSAHYAQLQFGVVQKLASDSPFHMTQEVVHDTIDPQKLSKPNTFTFQRNTSGQSDKSEDDFVIATSDIKHPLVRVHLHVGPQAKGGR